jgi:hypothetical protein
VTRRYSVGGIDSAVGCIYLPLVCTDCVEPVKLREPVRSTFEEPVVSMMLHQ